MPKHAHFLGRWQSNYSPPRKINTLNDQQTWIKGDSGLFDVTKGAYNRMEVCELVGSYLLNELSTLYQKKDIGFYRDEERAIFKYKSGLESEKIKKVNSIYISGERIENNHPVKFKNCRLFRCNFQPYRFFLSSIKQNK